MANIIGQRIAMPQIAAPQAAQAQLLQVPADAPPAVGSLGGLFQSVAGPFMDTASRDYKNAETMRALAATGQINQAVGGTKSLADLAGSGADLSGNPAFQAAILAGRSPKDLAGFRLSQVLANPANPVGGDLAVRASQAAEVPYSSTVAGTTQAEAATQTLETMREAARAAAQENAARIAAAAEVQKAGMTPVIGQDANGNPIFSSQGAFLTTPGFHPAQTKDQVVAGLLVNAIRGQAGGAAPGAPATAGPTFTSVPPAAPGATLDVNAPLPVAAAPGPAAATAAPRTPFDIGKLPYWLQKEISPSGTPDAIPYTEVNTNVVGQSTDGGRTITLPGGKVVDATSGQWVRGDPTTATGEARTAIAKQQAAAPSQYAGANPLQGDIARAALVASGLPAAVRSHANALVGAVTGGALPELDPQTERARQTLAIFDQTIKPALLNSAAKGSREQAIVQGMLPSGSAFENPETVARNVGQIHAYLLQQNGIIRNVIQSTASPQILQDYQQRLAENEAALAAITQGSAGRAAATAAKQAPKAAPAPAAPVAGAQAATPAPAKLPPGVTADQAIAEAQSAIKANPAAREAIMGRLRNWGLDLNTAQPGTTGGTF